MTECGPTDLSIFRFLYAFSIAIENKDADIDLMSKYYIDVLPNMVLKASNIGQK